MNKNKNLNKITEKATHILENIPETNDLFDSKMEKKEKSVNKYYFKRKKPHIKSLKRYNKRKKEKENSKDKTIENSKENGNDTSKDEKNDDSYYTNLHLEDIINKNKEKKGKEEEDKKTKEEEEKKNKESVLLNSKSSEEYLLQHQKYIHAQNNNKLLSNIIDFENENKNKKNTNNIKDDFKVEELEEKKEEDNKNKIRVKGPKKESKIYFKNMKGKSLEDIEKKKIELLYRFKHDIKYKISTGGVHSNEMENFEESTKNINIYYNKC